MTLITSLFDKGIFKNTLKRFKWGSILYFAMLFFTVTFPLFVMKQYYLDDLSVGVSEKWSILMTESRLIIPILLAITVPTAVAVLVQNNVHSVKQGIFMHGLPINRKRVYFSQFAASAALMLLPVLANTVILALMSMSEYGKIMPIGSVFTWFAVNASILFIMFSVAVFSGYLTGNTAAHIGINAFLHLIPLLIAVAITLISNIFLYGYVESDNSVAESLVIYNPITWLFTNVSRYGGGVFGKPEMWIYLLIAVVIYALSFVLYKKRSIESCGDVAAFAAFRPILKYSAVAAVVTAIFMILYHSEMPRLATIILAAVFGAICYFAAEMLLSKSVKVFGKYKGYIGFMAFTTLFVGFFALTSVFGYETRIPDKEDISEVAMYEGYSEENMFIADSEFIDECIEIHKGIIEDIPVTTDDDYYPTTMKYKLKNGKEIMRRYYIETEKSDAIMERLYKYEEYKLKVTGFNKLIPENVTSAILETAYNYGSLEIQGKDARELLTALEKDIRSLSYQELRNGTSAMTINLSIGLRKSQNDLLHYFVDSAYGGNAVGYEAYAYDYHSFSIYISAEYKNTMEFLKENGFYDVLIEDLARNMSILRIPVSVDENSYVTYKGQSGDMHEFMINYNDCVPIAYEDAKLVIEDMMEKGDEEFESGDYYFVYLSSDVNETVTAMTKESKMYREDSLPEYLKKYIINA